jgi:hypothetical protein
VVVRVDEGSADIVAEDESVRVVRAEEYVSTLQPGRRVRPQQPLLASGSVLTRERSYTITGSAQPGSTVTVHVADGPVGQTTAGAEGLFEYEFYPNAEAEFELWTVATGPHGTSSVESLHVVVEFDWTPPVLEIDSPYWPEVSGSPVELVGITEPGAVVSVEGVGETVAASDGSFSIEVPVEDGDNQLVVVVRDAAGNEFTANMVIALH